mmetsp:Transcript_4427/g.14291  ORF Transcript_4427/g.14291 Transcript_4427/m.14291 type:complete len:338 (+) Transcript_4427:1347-2360(+)
MSEGVPPMGTAAPPMDVVELPKGSFDLACVANGSGARGTPNGSGPPPPLEANGSEVAGEPKGSLAVPRAEPKGSWLLQLAANGSAPPGEAKGSLPPAGEAKGSLTGAAKRSLGGAAGGAGALMSPSRSMSLGGGREGPPPPLVAGVPSLGTGAADSSLGLITTENLPPVGRGAPYCGTAGPSAASHLTWLFHASSAGGPAEKPGGGARLPISRSSEVGSSRRKRRKRSARSRTGMPTSMCWSLISRKLVSAEMRCRLFWICARTISALPSRRRNSSRMRHLSGCLSFFSSRILFQMMPMMEVNSTVNVPLAISRMSETCGSEASLHVASRTICSISE